MNNFFIYKYLYDGGNSKQNRCYTIVFCPREDIFLENLISELRKFHEINTLPDEVLVIACNSMEEKLKTIFIEDFDNIFRNFRGFAKERYKENLNILCFDKDGKLLSLIEKKIDANLLEKIIQEGLCRVFLDRGGLVISPLSHHFEFPSNKHSNQFLRTANILLYSSEIFFIAFTLLKYYREQGIRYIYCDTSSINTLAFAIIELKRRFVKDLQFPPIESFGSYEKFRESRIKDLEQSFVLISSSTSGNIIDKLILTNNPDFNLDNLVITYFLGTQEAFLKHKRNILCNLTKSENNPDGLTLNDGNNKKGDCKLCQSGSIPLKVGGDVFLLEKPQIKLITLVTEDAPRWLSPFVENLHSLNQIERNIIRCNFKETNERDLAHEIYLNTESLFSEIGKKKSSHFSSLRTKFYKYLDTYIPLNTKYIIHLPDNGSVIIANLIQASIQEKSKTIPALLEQNTFLDSIKDQPDGAVVVVASSFVLGKNLLFISRALRTYNNLSIIYFIGIARPRNEKFLEFVRKNIGFGNYGITTYPWIELERIYCSDEQRINPWQIEFTFIKKIKNFFESNFQAYQNPKVELFITKRFKFLQDHRANKGFANDLFYRRLHDDEPLLLRKNFAFWQFEYYANDNIQVSQADVYFTISALLNNLRNSKNLNRTLEQFEFSRNLLHPENFARFNDGIIQACLLRASKPEELSYKLDEEASTKALSILNNLLKYWNNDHGEAIMEFIYSIARNQLKLVEQHEIEFLASVKSTIDDPVIHFILDFMEYEKKNS